VVVGDAGMAVGVGEVDALVGGIDEGETSATPGKLQASTAITTVNNNMMDLRTDSQSNILPLASDTQ
jgi:hypothetical protein